MDSAQFQKLLLRGEGPTIDFKATDYLLHNDPLKGDFVKDVLALLNTPRDEDGHVIMGVKRHADGRTDLLGIPHLKDDNNYQQILMCVDPTPVIDFETVEHEGKCFGVMRVSRARRGPFCATRDVGTVKKGVLYWRQGSMNTEAATMADQKAIHRWAAEAELTQPQIAAGTSDDWQLLVDRTDNFAPAALFILVSWGLSDTDRGRVSGLGRAPWLAVLDFDTASSRCGLALEVLPVLKDRRVVHEVIFGDRPTIHRANATYWYYARGLEGRATSLVTGGLRSWRGRYQRDIGTFLDSIAEATDLAPLHVVCVFPSGGEAAGAPYCDTVLSLITQAFGERATFHLGGTNLTALSEVATQHEGKQYQLEPSDIARGVGARYADTGGAGADEYSLPGRAGVPNTLVVKERLWVEEELEPVYLSAGLVESGASTSVFLNGGLPSWWNLALHDDGDRDIAPKLLRQLRQDLGLGQSHSASTVRVNIYHEPGVGGSTLARRVLWDLHREVPCVVLQRCTPMETTERLRAIYNVCQLPVLALVEGADITDTVADDLYSRLRAQQVPVVMLRVLRSFQAPVTVASRDAPTRVFYLPPSLSRVESSKFAELFGRAVPGRKAELLRLAAAGDGERHPFYFGLVSFERDFRGLAGFVTARLAGATAIQQKILAYLAIAYCYGQKSLPAQAFASLLGLPPSRIADLTKALTGEQRQLLRAEMTAWRPVHQVVGEELLRQILDPQTSDRDVWKQNLAHWAREFATFCRGEQAVVSGELSDVVARCFLLRDSREVIGREDASAFSRLIEDIPSLDAQSSVIELLTELFPDEPHVWAHAGRFAFQRMRNPSRARELIDRAIALSPDDHVLYHIKGMAFRSECYDLMDRIRTAGKLANVEELERLVSSATEQFGEARARAPEDEHGYISQVQMLIRVVDALRAVNGGRTVEALASLPGLGPLVRRAVDEAGYLLEQVRANREGERVSEYAVRCSAGLDALYGNYAAVLQAWDGLLSRADVYKPPVRRQLVRAYLAKHERRWQALTQKEIERSVDLLQRNILEEPAEEQNLRLWVQAVRRLAPAPAIGQLLERVAYWRTNSESVDAAYYFYVLHAVEALAGSPLSRQALDDAIAECRRRARARRNRNHSFEWLGPGTGVAQLIHHNELGPWDDEADFWTGTEVLHRVRGRVAKISGPEAGFIELAHGVQAFFVPSRANIAGGRDQNQLVELLVGFTYDGPRGYQVRAVSE